MAIIPTNKTYVDSEGNEREYPQTGQGPAVKVEPGSIEESRDETGFTHPNLHRRVDPQLTDFNYPAEFKPRSYDFQIQGHNSFRTTTYNTHDENATEPAEGRDVEIP